MNEAPRKAPSMMSSFAMSCRGGLGRLGETGTVSVLFDADAVLVDL